MDTTDLNLMDYLIPGIEIYSVIHQSKKWEGYVTPLLFKTGDLVKIPDTGKALIGIYSHFDKEKQIHCCFKSVLETGEIEYSEHNQVDKFKREDGYFFAKQLYSKMEAGRKLKQQTEQL
jgi:hypothetical protein